RVLRRRLETFRGVECAAMQFVSFASDSAEKVWEKMGGQLGLLNIKEGETWTAPDAFPRMAGVSMGDGMLPSTVLIALESPVPGTAYIGIFPCGGMAMAYMGIYLYGDNAQSAVEHDEPIWQAWLDNLLPAPQMG
ncbi:MAG: hypothetical protein KDA31_12040, partial [Phycisphaerales bacterium]|nr:hypothetical protein [Phycisphaerales bacterium]